MGNIPRSVKTTDQAEKQTCWPGEVCCYLVTRGRAPSPTAAPPPEAALRALEAVTDDRAAPGPVLQLPLRWYYPDDGRTSTDSPRRRTVDGVIDPYGSGAQLPVRKRWLRSQNLINFVGLSPAAVVVFSSVRREEHHRHSGGHVGAMVRSLLLRLQYTQQ